MYVLQPITEVLPNYENPEASKKQRSKATGEWFKSFNQMQLVLRETANKALSEEDAVKYSLSGNYKTLFKRSSNVIWTLWALDEC